MTTAVRLRWLRPTPGRMIVALPAVEASLEYAHAQKLLAGEEWTFEELCERVGEDGVLR